MVRSYNGPERTFLPGPLLKFVQLCFCSYPYDNQFNLTSPSMVQRAPQFYQFWLFESKSPKINASIHHAALCWFLSPSESGANFTLSLSSGMLLLQAWRLETDAHSCVACRKQAWNSAPQGLLAWFQEHFGLWLLPYYPKLGDTFQHSPELLLNSVGQFPWPLMLEQLRLWMFVQGKLWGLPIVFRVSFCSFQPTDPMAVGGDAWHHRHTSDWCLGKLPGGQCPGLWGHVCYLPPQDPPQGPCYKDCGWWGKCYWPQISSSCVSGSFGLYQPWWLPEKREDEEKGRLPARQWDVTVRPVPLPGTSSTIGLAQDMQGEAMPWIVCWRKKEVACLPGSHFLLVPFYL